MRQARYHYTTGCFSFPCAALGLLSFGGFCSGPFLSLGSLLPWPSVSLASVSLTYSFPRVLHTVPRLISLLSWVSRILPPWPLLVLLRLWPWVILVHLIHNSVASQFLRDGVLPLGRVISCGAFLGFFWSSPFLFLGRSSAPGSDRWFSFSSLYAFGVAVCPQLRFASLGFITFSLSPWVFPHSPLCRLSFL